MELTGPDPSHLFIRFIGWGAAIFLMIRFLMFLLPILLHKEKPRNILLKIFPVAELIFWLIYLSWFVILFSEADELYVFVVLAILLMVLFWISRFWVKDIIAGVIFRSSTRLKVEDQLHFGELKGTIKKFGNYSIELETQDNQTVFIPYGKLVDDVNIKSERTGQSKGYTFPLVCPRSEESNIVTQQIKSTILSTPWVSVTRMPVITLTAQTDENYTFEITFFPIDKSFVGKIETLVQEKYAGKKDR
ncbi:MAG: mechanosensitive ion channel [Bacteroidia bacterium]|nr:mechanosensitive ion channel [Bacteroidia bacterium]